MENSKMHIRDIAKKVSDFLYANGYNGKMYFDHSSYDFDEDIPRYNHNKINEIQFNEQGTYLEITCKVIYTEIDFNEIVDISEDDYDELYAILSNIYYNVYESWEIGDFEVDFLGI